jgi:AcrR family transcriptional regulator
LLSIQQLAYRARDAGRSREAILAAATQLFAQHGYDATSLAAIASAADLSRGAPNYFFTSTQDLYVEVLEHAFAVRQAATRKAFEPVEAWCRGGGNLGSLRGALRSAASDYVRFLTSEPDFPALVLQEQLAGGQRLRGRTTGSTAIKDAFTAVRRIAPARGLAEFEVDDAVLLFVALTFTPVGLASTLMRTVRRSRRALIELAVDQVMHLVSA